MGYGYDDYLSDEVDRYYDYEEENDNSPDPLDLYKQEKEDRACEELDSE